MTRTIDAAVVTELATDGFNMANLVRMGFQVGSPLADVMITDAQFPINHVHSSPQVTDTYLSSGHMLDLRSVSENADLRVGKLSVDLSSVEQTYSTIFLTTDYVDVQFRWYRALVDSSYTVIGSPILMFDGRISGYKLSERGDKSVLSIDCASHWANFDIISGRKSNQNSQQSFFPSDLGMDFAAHPVYDIKWGRS